MKRCQQNSVFLYVFGYIFLQLCWKYVCGKCLSHSYTTRWFTCACISFYFFFSRYFARFSFGKQTTHSLNLNKSQSIIKIIILKKLVILFNHWNSIMRCMYSWSASINISDSILSHTNTIKWHGNYTPKSIRLRFFYT